MTDVHHTLCKLATATTLPVKGNKAAAAELVQRGLARPHGNTKITITPAGAFAARTLPQEGEGL